MALEEDLFFYNPWWVEGSVPEALAKPYRRRALEVVRSHVDGTDRVVVLKGPRRVGKTTLCYQLVADRIAAGVPPKRILYVSFDDPKLRAAGLEAALEVFETRVLGKKLAEEPTLVILDEVQFLDGWEFSVKKYVDRHYPIRFLATGSAATLIKKSTESLAGRTLEETMLPFSFREFFEYRTGKRLGPVDAGNAVRVRALETDARLLFEQYLLRGGFPSAFDLPSAVWAKALKEDVVEKTVYKDITQLYDVKRPEVLEKMLVFLLSATGQTVNVSSISRNLGLSREYAEKYLAYLQNAFLVKTLPKYGASPAARVRAEAKAYAIDPGVANAVLNRSRVDETTAGHLVESLVATHLPGEAFYVKRNGETDFAVKDGGRLHVLEVKYAEHVSDREKDGLRQTARALKAASATIVTKNTLEKTRGIELVPAWLWLLTQKP